MTTLLPGPRRGAVIAPPSKSHEHRLLIANFLASTSNSNLQLLPSDAADILATKRCLMALSEPTTTPTLDCGESGSTLRFLAPIAAALGMHPTWIRRGRLAERPFKDYAELLPGVHTLPGNVSSQFVTGLLFALPLLKGDSQIRFSSPLESRGYVDMTLNVLHDAGIEARAIGEGEALAGFDIPGSQRYTLQSTPVEGDWSGAAFWLAMNALGSSVEVAGLNPASAQPDRVIVDALQSLNIQPPTLNSQPSTLNLSVSQYPDIFPVLTVVAAAKSIVTTFTGIRRLRLKECDRVEAMQDVLTRFGRKVDVMEDAFTVHGSDAPFMGGEFTAYDDHRIAMSIAVGATRAASSVAVDNIACAAKSYPDFFHLFSTSTFNLQLS